MTVKPGWARKRDRLRRREPDAARPGAEEPPEPDTAASTAAAPPWALSAAEWRQLVITFAGGLGSIVAAACVIGVAIAADKGLTSSDLRVLELYTAAVLGGLVLVWWSFKNYSPDDRVSVWLRRFSIAVVSVGLVLALLVWIGLAAGVK
jgi:hypothetical protein